MRQLCGPLIDGGENRQIQDAWSVVLSDEGATHVRALSRVARGPCTVVSGPPPLSQRPGSLGPALRVPAARVHWACGAHTADTRFSVETSLRFTYKRREGCDQCREIESR